MPEENIVEVEHINRMRFMPAEMILEVEHITRMRFMLLEKILEVDAFHVKSKPSNVTPPALHMT